MTIQKESEQNTPNFMLARDFFLFSLIFSRLKKPESPINPISSTYLAYCLIFLGKFFGEVQLSLSCRQYCTAVGQSRKIGPHLADCSNFSMIYCSILQMAAIVLSANI